MIKRTALPLLLLLLLLLLPAGCNEQDPITPAADQGAPDQLAAVLDQKAPAPDRAAPDLAPPPDAAAPGLKVLFVGNSYTQANNLPTLVSGLAKASGKAPAIVVDSVLVGGATLQQHFENAQVLSKLKTGGFSHAVFQGQSVEALYSPTNFGTYAKKLADEANKYKITGVWFETWARVAGHDVYKYAWSGGNAAAMQKDLGLAYSSVAKATGGLYVPVGDAWEASLKAHPAIKLHEGDGSHPNIHGSYLAACVFYGVLAKRSAEGIGGVPAAVSKANAAKLAKIAWATVQKN